MRVNYVGKRQKLVNCTWCIEVDLPAQLRIWNEHNAEQTVYRYVKQAILLFV